jgi:surface polysaccharide O-acyltransferase-like enzyme
VRLQRIDAFRFYSIILILYAHTQYFGGIDLSLPFTRAFSIAVVTLARPTIQFFFILSGFFLGGKILEAPDQALAIARKYTWKLLIVFLFWCVVYALANPHEAWTLLTHAPDRLLFEGTRVHLWYLPSLILTVWLFALWPFNRASWTFPALGGILFVLGLLGGAYRLTPPGLDLRFNTRDGVFFSTLFFAIGAWFHAHKPAVSKGTAVGIYLVGLVLFSVECYFLWTQYGLDPIKNDYVLGSIPYGIGLFLIAYLFDATRLDQLAAPFASLVLGMYVAHMLILDLILKPLHKGFNPILWQQIAPIALFFLTFGLVWGISKTPFKRVLGMD